MKQELELKQARKELGEETFGEFIREVPSKVKAGFAKVGEMKRDVEAWQEKVRSGALERPEDKSLAELQDEQLEKEMARDRAEMKAEEASIKAEELEMKREERCMKKETEAMREQTRRVLKRR